MMISESAAKPGIHTVVAIAFAVSRGAINELQILSNSTAISKMLAIFHDKYSERRLQHAGSAKSTQVQKASTKNPLTDHQRF